MVDKAHLATDELLDKMERRLRAIYTRASREIGEAWKAYLQESGTEISDLQRQYQEAKAANDTELMRQLGKRLQRAKRERTLMDERYRELTQQTAEQLAHVNETATAFINKNLPEVYTLNYNSTGEAFDGIGGYSFTLTDADTVRNLVESDRSFLPMRDLDFSRDVAWNIEKMNAEVLQGILQGESMDKIADRLAQVIGMNLRSAVSAARTMVTSAENKGRQDGFERAAALGIILEREWIATSDGRTRDWHRELDGVTAAVDEPFENAVGKIMYPGDPSADGANLWNCRCTIAAVVKGFKSAQAQKAMAEKQAEERQASAFTPAKTTEEAEAYAKEHIFSGAYLGKTSYKGIDVDMANGINETLERITEKYGKKLSGIEVVNPKTAKGLKTLGGSADAPFATNSLNGMVYINKDILKNAKTLRAYTDKGDEAFKLVMANKDKLSGKMRTLAEIYEKAGKDLVDSSLEGMITHEYGHYLAVAINPKADVVSKIADGMSDHLISGYSQHNVREYIAECFTEYERGDRRKLDPIVIELFEGAIKR